ncbi:amino acid adenylation domain-containing protein [Pseudomonas mangiferae]|uniref:amino acid adenylation domain-containing protein n=1 Tax=Pseudomonas mangiferae TaxID=2593654 RepID=UPI00389AD50A
MRNLPGPQRQALFALLRQKGVDVARLPIQPALDGEPRPLSYAQQRQWVLWQLDPQSSAYHIPTALSLRGPLDVDALRRSFASLVERHAVFRTRFVEDDEGPRQVIDPPASFALPVEPLADDPAQVRACLDDTTRRPFDLAREAPLRVRLLRLGDDHHVLALILHHIVSDGWSSALLVDELLQGYLAWHAGQPPHLPALPIQYADYAAWQRQWLASGEEARQLAYWTAQLGEEQPVLQLPSRRARPEDSGQPAARVELAIDPALGERLRQVARDHAATPFMLLLASFQALLHRYSGQADIRVGVPVANRTRAETERLIGFFVNTQVLKATFAPGMRVLDLFQQVRDTALAAQTHQDLPFERLVERLQPERSLDHTPLFQVLFNHQSGAQDGTISGDLAGLRIEPLEAGAQPAQFDLTLSTHDQPDGLQAALIYDPARFEPGRIETLGRHWLSLLQAMLDTPHAVLDDLPLLATEEHQRLADWNATRRDYPDTPFVQRLFERQARVTPDAPALRFAGQQLSYDQLNRQANRLAHRLMARGVGPDTLVGVAMERSVDLVVSLLAVLKAGGAYVPLDPDYPAERLAYMLDDSGVGLLLTQRALLERLPSNAGLACLCVDDSDDAPTAEHDPAPTLQAGHLAYVIYTSGSTGRPKGAGNSHGALYNRLAWMQEAYGLEARDRVLQKTPFSFDVSVWEFFWPLMTGACLVVAAPGEHRDPARLIETIRRDTVTTLHFVPSMLLAFIHEDEAATCDSLTRIVCSGEALPTEAQALVFERLPNAALYNLYGPTEAAIDVTHWTCRDEGSDTVPIGHPIANLRTHVLDAGLSPVPVGCSGELYLGGVGLARGYHRRPALTAERFVPDPFQPGERLYRTGDLARYRDDGALEYLGRLDHQVKLRGQRIELGEIEARLQEAPGVREAAVLALPVDKPTHLVAYLVLDTRDPAISLEAVQQHLRSRLPEHMLPTRWELLERMPLSPNGKLDRKALPAPAAIAADAAGATPETPMEQTLAAIWQDVLGLERVAADANFFSLGGDSIIAIQVVSRARRQGIRLAPRDLFEHQTVQALARVARHGEAVMAEQGLVQGASGLTPIQHAFFASDIPARPHWNQALLLRPRHSLDAGALALALDALYRHHDALRLRFQPGAEGWQAHHAGAEANDLLWQRDVDDAAALEALCETAQRSLDLGDGPLLRGVLATLPNGQQRLLLVFHHLVVDGVSWRILLEDLQGAYQAAVAGHPIALPAKTSAFRDWTARLSAFAREDALQAELAYWEDLHRGATAELPRDHDAGRACRAVQRTVHTRLDRAATRRLLQDAPAAYRTRVNDLLLAALGTTLGRWTGAPATLVQLEGHGREDLFETLDLTRSVGWFTSTYPVRLAVEASPGATLKAVKEHLRGIPHNGIGHGVLRHLGDASARARLAALPEPRVTFNYLGQFDGSFDEDALFAPAAEASGACHDPQAPLDNWLSINGEVYDGELVLGWTFSEEQFDDATVQRLADAYAGDLQTLVTHCLEVVDGGLTPSDVPLSGLDQRQLDALPRFEAPLDDLYPLSPMQQGMLFHSQEDDQGLYVNQTSVPVEGLDVQRFADAWRQATRRHAILRSAFLSRTDWKEPLQAVLREADTPIEVLDWRGHADPQAALRQLAEDDCARGFDLEQAPLQRLTLVRLDAQNWHLIWTSHHILMDGWSRSRLLGEVLHAYAGQPLPPVAGDYRDYIGWLRRQPADALETFWKHQLANLATPTHLAPCAHPQPDPGLVGHGARYLEWDVARTARLLEAARHHRVTPNTLIQAAWLLLLHRYTGQASVCFGATVAGRPAGLAGAEDMLGLFINTLPIIQTVRPEGTVGDWLQALQQHNLQVRDHEHASLADIQRWSGQGGQALFDSILVFENYPLDKRLQGSADNGLRFGSSENRDVTNFAMDLAVHLGDHLNIEFLYLRQRFTDEACTRLVDAFETLLDGLLARPEARLGDLPMLDRAARQRLEQDNRLDGEGRQLPPVAEAIRTHAARQPGATALVCGEDSLDYAGLEDRANRLAHWLMAAGIGPDDRVGVAFERSLDLVVALYAVHKAGAAYVPMDIDYPEDRLRWIMEDSRMALLLTHRDVPRRLPQVDGLAPAVLEHLPLASQPADCPPQRALPDHLAYLIYTSGSTGKPKGVAVAHGPLRGHCEAIVRLYEMDEGTRELLFMSFAFDGAHERWLSTLLAGGCLVIRDNGLWTPEQTWQALHRERISIACFPPAYLQQLADHAEAQGNPPPVRIYCFGGDAVADAAFRQVTRALQPRYLTNGYGPTETVVTPMLWKVAAGETCGAAYAPIGQRVGQRRLYVLDGELNLLPDGVAGELYIGGDALARGYHDRPGLTAERFVADPFATGERMYRTGDLVRRRTDGVIDYLGRLDHQVKIRGFRIELGEIEARLRGFPEVREALVVAREHETGKQLVGYVVTDETAGLGDALRQRLQQALPDYMVPAQVMVLAAFPLSPNGKLDRQALPAPTFRSRAFVAPRNELERRLAAIWQEVLGVEQVGVTDNFFELGGDSLRTLKVISKVRAQRDLGFELKLRDMMAKPTIGELSGYHDDATRDDVDLDPLLPLNRTVPGNAPLFCLHAGFGTVFDYEPLARRLEGRRSVYGLQCRMLLDRAWQDDSLEAMAIDYAQYIRQKQPSGPYHLLGWSLGGTLAVLVARELERQGQAIAYLGLVDSYLPSMEPAPDDTPWAEELRQFLQVLLATDVRLANTTRMQPDQAEVERLVADVLASADHANAGHAALGAEELAHTFLVACRLKYLARQADELPALGTTADGWWAQGDDEPLRQRFEAGVLHGCPAQVLNTGHYDLLDHPRLLDALHARLAPAASPVA